MAPSRTARGLFHGRSRPAASSTPAFSLIGAGNPQYLRKTDADHGQDGSDQGEL
jgi:hypothetical protein